MAKVYYVKDGPRPSNFGPGREISLSELERRVQNIEIKYLSSKPPEFNKKTPSIYPLRVVVEVETKESKSQLFNKTGFYILLQLTPGEAEPLIFSSS